MEDLRIRVLIADDHEVVRKEIRSILLSRPGIEICAEASDGAEAVSKALAAKPDIIVLDIAMPKMNGFQAADELLRRLPGTPILFCSVYQSPQMLNEARRIGVRGLLNKAKIASVLLDAVEALIVRQVPFFPDELAATARL